MLVTGLFSIVTGIINAPDTFLSQPVIVAASPTISYVNDSEPSDDDFSPQLPTRRGRGIDNILDTSFIGCWFVTTTKREPCHPHPSTLHLIPVT